MSAQTMHHSPVTCNPIDRTPDDPTLGQFLWRTAGVIAFVLGVVSLAGGLCILVGVS